MHQFVSVNATDDDSMNFRCLRYNLDDVTFGKASDNIELCPKDACLSELPLTNPSWRTCKRKWSQESIRTVPGPVRSLVKANAWPWERWNSYDQKSLDDDKNICECHFNGNTPMCGFDGFECEPSLGPAQIIFIIGLIVVPFLFAGFLCYKDGF